jgi:serpin B
MKISKLAILNTLTCLLLISYQKMHAQPTNSTQVTSGNNQFAFDLYKTIKSNSDNAFYSPFSISVALGMTVEGAKNTTRKEMLKTMHLPEDDLIRQTGFRSLLTAINAPDKQYKLSTANSIWVQSGMTLKPEFETSLKNNFKGGLNSLNFKVEGDNCRVPINDWVANNTNQKIIDLIPEKSINKFTRMVLTNAIYFKGQWKKEFSKELTSDQYFHLIDQKSVVVPMMQSLKSDHKYLKTENAAILEIPYKNDELSMILILPDPGKFSAVEAAMSEAQFEIWQKQMTNQTVDVTIPKFKFRQKLMLSQKLKEMGMEQAFTDVADFSGMTKDESLKISEVIHEAFIEVNEEGTEAAAATAVIMVRTESKEFEDQTLQFRADRPFIFILKHKSKGSILFMGRVMNPLTN